MMKKWKIKNFTITANSVGFYLKEDFEFKEACKPDVI